MKSNRNEKFLKETIKGLLFNVSLMVRDYGMNEVTKDYYREIRELKNELKTLQESK